MPLFLNAEPQNTGKSVPEAVAARIAWRTSASVSSAPRRYFSRSSSWCSTAASSSSCRSVSTLARSESGIPTSVIVAPSSSSQTYAFMATMSITPVKRSASPRGYCTANAFAPSRSRIMPTTWSKSAPVRSILLTNAIRGTPYRSAWRHTVSDWGSTPPTAQKTATAPSSTRSDRSTSAVKST